MDRRLGLITAAAIAAVLAGCDTSDPKNSYANVTESKRRGDAIVVALGEFKTKHGRYPNSLAELREKSQFVVENPVVADAEWRYLGGGAEFVLQFCMDEGCYPNYSITSTRGWMHDN